MKRTTILWLGLACLLGAPAFAAEKNAAAAPKEEPKIEVKPAGAAAPAKEEAAKAEPDKVAGENGKDGKNDSQAKEGDGHKSNGIATTLAFFPGMAIHGAGHMYAGSWMKGTGLLAIEGVSVWLGVRYGTELSDDIGSVTKTSGNAVPTDFGPVYSRLGIILVATSAFLYTWFDDMAGASTAVDMYNKKVDKSRTTAFRLAPSGDGFAMVYQRQF